MKYIIDVSDEAIELMGGHISIFVEPVFRTGDCKHYALRLSKEDIEPYTEPDKEQIENEVWNFVSKFVWSFEDKEILGMGIAHAVRDMTYQEAKAKFKAWSKQNIRKGDEVIYDSRTKAVVLIPETKERYGTILTSEFDTIVVSHDELEKTGRHFSDIEELLKKTRNADD